MTLNDRPTHYDVLDLGPDASSKDIQEAYLRIKSTYNKDSVALYTLVNSEEREQMLSQLEEAYRVLSHPDRRKEYDRCHGLLILEKQANPFEDNRSGDIVSIDRVPPMDSLTGDDILVPPSTAFDQAPKAAAPSLSTWVEVPQTPPPSPPAMTRTPPQTPPVDTGIGEELSREIEWHGSLLKRVRESRRISIEELSSITKISRTYLQAIETENFPKMPAAVFVRGFITQIAKVLKLPHDKVAPAYLARYFQARPDQKT